MSAATYHPLNSRRAPAGAEPRRLRLVLFGFAGGSITALLSLARAMPPWIEVWGAEYPGRGMRWQNRPLESVEPLLEDLLPGLNKLRDMPVVLLGYSMGAHVAYRLGLQASLPPLGVVAVSAQPPGDFAGEGPLLGLSDADLVVRLHAAGGIPAEILDNKVMMESFLPVLRADLALCEDMKRFVPRALSCPLLALHGEEDLLLTGADMPRWLEVAGGRRNRSVCQSYPGGHFFHKGSEPAVGRFIASWLAGLLLEGESAAARQPSYASV